MDFAQYEHDLSSGTNSVAVKELLPVVDVVQEWFVFTWNQDFISDYVGRKQLYGYVVEKVPRIITKLYCVCLHYHCNF